MVAKPTPPTQAPMVTTPKPQVAQQPPQAQIKEPSTVPQLTILKQTPTVSTPGITPEQEQMLSKKPDKEEI